MRSGRRLKRFQLGVIEFVPWNQVSFLRQEVGSRFLDLEYRAPRADSLETRGMDTPVNGHQIWKEREEENDETPAHRFLSFLPYSLVGRAENYSTVGAFGTVRALLPP